MRALRTTAITALGLFAVLSCQFDGAYRDEPTRAMEPDTPEPCVDGALSCGNGSEALSKCIDGVFVVVDSCAAKQTVCSETHKACVPCTPGKAVCSGADVVQCRPDGQAYEPFARCSVDQGESCREGECVKLCARAERFRSNVGCEYWAVDLDNAVVQSGNAAEQQFAVVVSNPDPFVTAHVTIEEDTAALGTPNAPRVVATAVVTPRGLEVFKLGPREVDGSPDGTFDTGTGTALSRGAFRVTSDAPIVAYQFNPLENANVFSNDASILLPTSSLPQTTGRSYVVAGWPQTIAITEDPSTNFGQNLRAFLTIVGTRENTKVKVTSRARIIPGGPVPFGVPVGGSFEVSLGPFEVLNLETGDFLADFTGSLVDSDKPVAVFVGSEASDAPTFATLAERSCCADHLESQNVPVRTAGKSYVLGHVPPRTRALAAAGADIREIAEPEYYRVVSATNTKVTVKTTLPAPFDTFTLDGEGASTTLTALRDFVLEASAPVIVVDVQASQEAAGVPRGLPGGDPSLNFAPPVEQWRADYTLLTPDKYAFDFLVIVAPRQATVYLDGGILDDKVCEIAPADGLTPNQRGTLEPRYLAYRCQLSFPNVDRVTSVITAGRQNDGVHRVVSTLPIGVLVYGFDAFVSYAFTGGTELNEIVTR